MNGWHSEDHIQVPREPHYKTPTRFRPPMQVNYVMYLHHEVYPKPPESFRYLCGCGYTIFKASTQNIVISNDVGTPWEEYEPGSNIIEIVCHNCHSTFKVLFQ
jgi:hypothetical protein